MIIYNPHDIHLIKDRSKEVETMLKQQTTKHCFITGSFIYKNKYNDIDIFFITRSKKEIKMSNKKAKVTIIDFNDIHSLFYHSISKSCISKNILPKKKIKVTISDFWHVVNEAVPTLLNQKNKYHKDVRFLVLYTEYFKTGKVFDTFQLDKKIKEFKDYKKILEYIKENVPKIMKEKSKKSYIKRFLYTQAGAYKEVLKYEAQRFLYQLTHLITRSHAHG
jgi:hypothetical protein